MTLARVQALAALEQRITAFIESQTGEPMKPAISLVPSMLQHQEHGQGSRFEFLLQARLARVLLFRRHLRDDHDVMTCSQCQSILGELRYEVERPVREFINANKELLAELKLLF